MTPARSSQIVVATAIVLGLSGCGDKKAASSSAPTPSSSGSDSAPRLPSVASKLGAYRVVDFSQDIDAKGMAAYREAFMRAAAGAPGLDQKAFPFVASEAAGREPDSFKREEVAKAEAGSIDAIRAAAHAQLEIRSGSNPNEGSLYVRVAPYDMDAQAYTIQIFGTQPSHGYRWNEGDRSEDYRIAISQTTVGCPELGTRAGLEAAMNGCSVEIVKRMPKDQAKEVEAAIASKRDAAQRWALVPIGMYVSAAKLRDGAVWNNATLETNLDAIAVYAPNRTMDKPLFVIDGPELVRK